MHIQHHTNYQILFGKLLYPGIILRKILLESNFHEQLIQYLPILLSALADFLKKTRSGSIITASDQFQSAKIGITNVLKGQL